MTKLKRKMCELLFTTDNWTIIEYYLEEIDYNEESKRKLQLALLKITN
jgi:hypothetical protein